MRARERTAAATAAKQASPPTLHHAATPAWVVAEGIEDTGNVPLPELLIEEVIGQEEAVEVAKKGPVAGS